MADVEKVVVEITSKYLRRGEEEIEKVYEDLGVTTLADLASLEVETLATAFSIKKSTAARIRNEALLALKESEQKAKGRAKAGDVTVPPYAAELAALAASRGTTVACIVAESFSGKTTLATFTGDQLIGCREGATLSTAGLAAAVEDARDGVVVDDVQYVRDASAIGSVARGLTDYIERHGSNRQYEAKLKDIVKRIVEDSLVVVMTWDSTQGNPALDTSSWKRVLLLPVARGTVTLPYKVKRFLARNHSVLRAMDVNRAADIEDTEDYSDTYAEFYETKVGVEEAVEDVDAVFTTVGEEAAEAVYWDYTDVMEVEDVNVVDWWFDTSKNFLLHYSWREFTDGQRRYVQAATVAFVMSVASLIGARYDWSLDSFNEFKECVTLTAEYMTEIFNVSKTGRFTSRARELEKIAKDCEPPF